jgi:ABC-type transport system involved in multi-copper enzyme maturation permease subunit
MLSHLIMKELKAILLSPKFPATFAICSILMLLSVYIGIQEYKVNSEHYSAANQLYDEKMHQAHSWLGLRGVALRQPTSLQVFVSGVNYDVGRLADIGTFQSSGAPTLERSTYSEDSIFAIFRFLDFAFIVQVVLTLFAIVFTYDAVSGEREAGTLQLLFSHPVSRAQFLLAKGIGSWLGLVIPLAVPLGLSILLVMVMGVPMSGTEWLFLALLILASLLYFTGFVVLGLAVSSLTRRSNLSFLVSLSIWILFVLVIPRAGVMIAEQSVRVPTIAQIDGQRAAYAKDRWAQFYGKLDSTFASNRGEAHSEEEQWVRFQTQDSLRQDVQNQVEANDQRIMEDLRRRKSVREKVGYTLARFSPAGSYYLAALQLAGTDAGVKDRYEDAILQYRNAFKEHVAEKERQTPGQGGITIEMDSETGFKFTGMREGVTLDVSDVPRFQPPSRNAAEVVASVVTDLGILGGFALIGFMVAFLGFLKYDVRQQ